MEQQIEQLQYEVGRLDGEVTELRAEIEALKNKEDK